MWGHKVDKLLDLVWGHHCHCCPCRMVGFGYRRKTGCASELILERVVCEGSLVDLVKAGGANKG